MGRGFAWFLGALALAGVAAAQDAPPAPVPAPAPAKDAPRPPGLPPDGKLGEPFPITLAQPATIYQAYLPKDFAPGPSRPLLLALHGAGDRPETFLEVILSYPDTHGWIVIAPKSAGMAWASGDGVMITAVLDDAVRRFKPDPDRTFLLGNSSGSGMASDWGFTNHERFRGIALCAGGRVAVGGTLLKAAGKHLTVLLAAGEMDPMLPGVKEAHARYVKEGFDTALHVEPGMGHSPLEPGIFEFVLTEWRKRIRRPEECLARAQRAFAEQRIPDVIANLDGCRIADPKISEPAEKLAAKLEKAGEKALADAATKAKRDRVAAFLLYEKLAFDYDGHPVGVTAATRLAELRDGKAPGGDGAGK